MLGFGKFILEVLKPLPANVFIYMFLVRNTPAEDMWAVLLIPTEHRYTHAFENVGICGEKALKSVGCGWDVVGEAREDKVHGTRENDEQDCICKEERGGEEGSRGCEERGARGENVGVRATHTKDGTHALLPRLRLRTLLAKP